MSKMSHNPTKLGITECKIEAISAQIFTQFSTQIIAFALLLLYLWLNLIF